MQPGVPSAWESYLENCPEYIFQIDADMKCGVASASFLKAVRLASGDIAGRPLGRLGFDSETARQIQTNAQQVFLTGEPVTWEGPLFFGDERRFEFLLTPARDEAGNAGFVLCSARRSVDLTRAKLQLRLYKAMLDHMAEGVVLVRDQDSVIVYTNPGFDEMFGYEPGELTGRHISILNAAEGEGPQAVAAEILATLQRDGAWSGEICNVKKDGTAFWCLANVSRFDHPDFGTMWLGVHQDISERKKVEIERQKFEEQAQRAQKLESLGDLAAGIAHDFNNIFTAIYANTELAIQTSTDPKTTLYIQNILNTIGRARSLTGQLLTFAPGGAPHKSVGPLFPLVRETVEFALSGANVSCRFLVEDRLWPCNFDRDRISQVIRNIVINAQQSMSSGGVVEIVAQNVPCAGPVQETQRPDSVLISVRDHGCGIPAEILPRIFDPFFTTRPNAGGLGLTISHSIIHQHGGSMDVESTPGAGTTVRIYLPAFLHAETWEPAATVQPDRGRILVMDDEELICAAVKDLLESSGYSAACALNGQEALDILARETRAGRPFSAVIVDLTVRGGMGGRETLAAIQEMNLRVPVFVASGYTGDPVLANPAAFGFAGGIAKPFAATELLKMLEQHLQTKENRGNSAIPNLSRRILE